MRRRQARTRYRAPRRVHAPVRTRHAPLVRRRTAPATAERAAPARRLVSSPADRDAASTAGTWSPRWPLGARCMRRAAPRARSRSCTSGAAPRPALRRPPAAPCRRSSAVRAAGPTRSGASPFSPRWSWAARASRAEAHSSARWGCAGTAGRTQPCPAPDADSLPDQRSSASAPPCRWRREFLVSPRSPHPRRANSQ